jgi:CheY-like chemotaxis protein
MTDKARVLIVEDEILVALRMEMDLSKLGYQIYEPVSTGEKAIKMVKEEPPDVVLMDIRLAGDIDGLETAQEIRAFSPIPIIFVTGYPNESLKEQAANLKPAAYLTKPVLMHEVQSAIETILEKPG